MNYNMNSFAFQCNRFASFTTNPYFNQNFIPNSVMNANVSQCFQCPNRPFVRTLIAPNVVNECHMQSTCTPRQLVTTIPSASITTSSSVKHSSAFTIDAILDTNNKINIKNNKHINSENSSTHSSQSIHQTIDVIGDVNKSFTEEMGDESEKSIYKWLSCTRFKPPKVKIKYFCYSLLILYHFSNHFQP